MRRSIIYGAAAALALVALGGCDNGLTGVNDNPNAPTDVDARYLLPNAITGAVGLTLGSNLHMDVTALWAQHYGESQYSTEDSYDISDSKIQGIWNGFYSGPLEDLHQIVQQGEEQQRPNAAAVAKILQAWTMSIVTDLWGDVPYTEALRGMEEGGTTTPAFDSQQSIYNSLLADLAAAPGMMDPSGSVIEDGDLIYGGDLTHWAQFANSLRMRLAMHLSEVDPDKAEQEFAAAYAAGGFTSNADNAQLDYVGDGTWDYPIFAYERDRDDHAVSATMIDTLQSLSDPRLPLYAKENVYGTYAGAPNGYDNPPYPRDSISRIGVPFASATTPAVIMSYAELLFLEAEAAERGWIAADAGELYTAAITANMEWNGIAQGDIDEYLAQPAVAYAGGADGLRQIALQKWIALYGNGPEAYVEWRRTGYPELHAGPDAVNGGVIPVRLPYPSVEQALNGANLSQAVSNQGGASLNDPLWWDK
ncbi:MAG TPA: SusD/RagB family nutrient-binding outer membrane lipoprotein [Gemmatimonadaceae bacterium]|nr:SusD/RagB family nutrient-binding outer membrane lipoprotein [Gemmatimonadaceae bacterium]